MDPAHKKSIITNLKILVEKTDVKQLAPKLMDKGVFSEDTVTKITANQSPQQCNRELYLGIQKRGPLAFRALVHSLTESGHFELATLLDPEFNVEKHFLELQPRRMEDINMEVDGMAGGRSHQRGGVVPNNFASYEAEHHPVFPEGTNGSQTPPLRVQVRPSIQYFGPPAQRAYKMMSNPKGYTLIINNVEFLNNCHEMREGAEVDGRNMQDLWEGLGYKVEYKENCGQVDARNAISTFAAKEEHSQVDSCVVVIMSHGFTEGIITADSKPIEFEWILRQFTNVSCPRLRGKPKLFFFQACRGDLEDYGARRRLSTSIDGITIEDPTASINPRSQVDATWEDMYTAYSSVPGYVSIRDHMRGSWFVEYICSVFMQYAWNTDLETMLKEVKLRVSRMVDEAGRKQTVVCEDRGFMYNLYFNPGLYANPSHDV